MNKQHIKHFSREWDSGDESIETQANRWLDDNPTFRVQQITTDSTRTGDDDVEAGYDDLWVLYVDEAVQP